MVVVFSGPASATKTDCCGCFQRKKRDSLTLSDIYCRRCSTSGVCSQRAPLGPPENQCTCTTTNKISNLLNESEYEFGKEKYKSKPKKKLKEKRNNTNTNNTEFEFADDAISLNNENFVDVTTSSCTTESHKETSFNENPYINVNGKEELPCVQEISKYCISNQLIVPNENVKTEPKIIIDNNLKNNKINTNFDGNYNKLTVSKIYSYCTLPKRKNNQTNNHKLRQITPPKRVTPDGTHIYYWCDMPKKNSTGKILRTLNLLLT